MRWPLPKPLYMPAGDAVQALIRYRSAPALAAVDLAIDRVNVTYVGRLAAPGTPPPTKRHVPWVASFETNSDNALAQTNDQFRNPFSDKPLYVQRFTQRNFIDINDPVGDVRWFFESIAGEGPGLSASPVYFNARLHDSLGYAIVPEYVPLNDVFDGTRAAWTFGRTLGPREQFDLQLQRSGTSGSATSKLYVQVGIVGFREENV
jgi:hypothetical protein